ncbi:MAG: 3-keto-disaccharide hydrolase [Bacteroidales bacterium]
MKTKGILMMLTAAFALYGISCKSTGKKTGDEEAPEQAAMEAPADNTLSQAEMEEGWMLLFDGTSTNGWRGYNKDSFPETGWTIEDGALKCIGSGEGEAGGQGGDIIYDRKFKDFHLKLDWKISEGGNSGIFYLAQEIPGTEIWKSAPEMQVLDNERHIDANLGKDGNRKAGSLYDLIPAKPQNAKPAGEWNHVEIIVYQGTVVHKMNGEQVLEYHLGTPDWEELVANSKFAEYAEFGKYREGYIALQDHGNDVWFKNIKLKEL